MLAELKVGEKAIQNMKPKTPQKSFDSFLVIGYSPLLMGDPQPNLKYRIITKREDYGSVAAQAQRPEMVWVRWKAYMTSLRPGAIPKHSKCWGGGNHQLKLSEPARLGQVDKKNGVPEKKTNLNKGAKGGTVKPG